MSTHDTSHDTPEFSITRTFDAPRDLVWRAWTDESQLAQWLHPHGVSTDSVRFDVRQGGLYQYTMTNDETGEIFPTGGRFLEVTPQDRLVFTWAEPGAPVDVAPVITLTFTPLDPVDGESAERTELVLHLAGIAGEPGDGYVHDGWAEALENLGGHLGDD